MRVLFLENTADPDVSVAAALIKPEFHVVRVASCDAVRDRAAQETFDLVVIDPTLVDCDLPHLCRELRETHAMPVLVVARANPHEPDALRVGRLVLLRQLRAVLLDGKQLRLTSHELSMLEVFMASPGQVLTREELIERTGQPLDAALVRAIDVRVSRLRSKLRDSARHPQILKTVRGEGYVLCAESLVG